MGAARELVGSSSLPADVPSCGQQLLSVSCAFGTPVASNRRYPAEKFQRGSHYLSLGTNASGGSYNLYSAYSAGGFSGATLGDTVLRLALIGLELKGHKASMKGLKEIKIRPSGAGSGLLGKIGSQSLNATAKETKELIVQLQQKVVKRYNAAVQRVKARLSAQKGLPPGFDPAKGFASFGDFKKAFGSAGSGQAWHHVVEQTINSGKFAAELLHNPANLFRLPHGKGTIHAKISGFYSSKQPFTGGQTVRQWLNQKSFQEQFDFGIQVIKDFGGSLHLPPHLR